jgi:hypothetical protein
MVLEQPIQGMARLVCYTLRAVATAIDRIAHGHVEKVEDKSRSFSEVFSSKNK